MSGSMNLILGIDPSKVTAGASLFDKSELIGATFIKSPITTLRAQFARPRLHTHVAGALAMAHAVARWVRTVTLRTPVEFVFEWPVSYDMEEQLSSQDELFHMPGLDCAIAGVYADDCGVTQTYENFYEYHPQEWKGSLKKKAMCLRVWERLTPHEQARVTRTPKGGGYHFDSNGGLDHNMLDGIGVVLHHLGRLERRRVFG